MCQIIYTVILYYSIHHNIISGVIDNNCSPISYSLLYIINYILTLVFP